MELKEMKGYGVIVNTAEEFEEYLSLCDNAGWRWRDGVIVAQAIKYVIEHLPRSIRAGIGLGHVNIAHSDWKHITLAEFKKEQCIMKYKEGDVLVNGCNQTRTVLGVCGILYFLSAGQITDEFESAYSERQLDEYHYAIKTAEPELTTLTMQDVAKLAGIGVDSLRIEK